MSKVEGEKIPKVKPKVEREKPPKPPNPIVEKEKAKIEAESKDIKPETREEPKKEDGEQKEEEKPPVEEEGSRWSRLKNKTYFAVQNTKESTAAAAAAKKEAAAQKLKVGKSDKLEFIQIFFIVPGDPGVYPGQQGRGRRGRCCQERGCSGCGTRQEGGGGPGVLGDRGEHQNIGMHYFLVAV